MVDYRHVWYFRYYDGTCNLSVMSNKRSKMDWETFLRNSRDIQRLDYVTRYTSIPVVTRESVSTHSFWVSVYSQMVCSELQIDDPLMVAAVLTSANIHDLVEMRSGDFVRTFKYKTAVLKAAVDEAEEILIGEFDEGIRRLYSVSAALVNESPCPGLVKSIVKAADFLSLYHYMAREILRSNYEVSPFFARMIDDLCKCKGSCITYTLNGREVSLSALYDVMHRNSQHLLMSVPKIFHQYSNREV